MLTFKNIMDCIRKYGIIEGEYEDMKFIPLYEPASMSGERENKEQKYETTALCLNTLTFNSWNLLYTIRWNQNPVCENINGSVLGMPIAHYKEPYEIFTISETKIGGEKEYNLIAYLISLNYNQQEFTGQIIDLFEDFLDEHGINIPNPEKQENGVSDEDANIYGTDYGNLSEDIQNLLQNWGILQ